MARCRSEWVRHARMTEQAGRSPEKPWDFSKGMVMRAVERPSTSTQAHQLAAPVLLNCRASPRRPPYCSENLRLLQCCLCSNDDCLKPETIFLRRSTDEECKSG